MTIILIFEYSVFFCFLLYLKISKQKRISIPVPVIILTGLTLSAIIYFRYLYNKQSIKEQDGIITNSGQIYELRKNLKPGDRLYIDRNYEYVNIPSDVAGEEYIKTANDDKLSQGNDFLQITLLHPALIYVGFDIRGTHSKLNWLKNSNFILTTDTRYVLYKKEFIKCPQVILGGNVLPDAK
jgi:hypothetical protein